MAKIEAYSPEWYEFRIGVLTASDLYDMICTPKKKPRPYVMKKLAERLTGESQDKQFINDSIAWGVENEPHAFKALIENVPTVELEEDSYFMTWEEMPNFGATCDRVGRYNRDKCVFEVKCPDTATHLRYSLMESVDDLKKVEPKYYWQIVGGAIVHDTDVGMFVSYDRRVKYGQLFYLPFEIDGNDIDIAKDAIHKTEKEIKFLFSKIKNQNK